MKHFFLTFLLSFFLVACSSKPQKELTIATNTWIGYTPLFYAKEMGYLKKLNIKLIMTVSLGEAADIFSVRKADMVTTTQHEYYALKHLFKDITPIILIDKSNGGDMILSNTTIEKLQQAKKIYTYLEIDSINNEMIEDFTSAYNIDTTIINYINKDQSQIIGTKFDMRRDILIATYSPYDTKLKPLGFQTVASTQDFNTITVIDAICTTQKVIDENKERLKELKKVINQSIEEIQLHPKKSYKVVSKFLTHISYEEYIHSLKSIQWLQNPSPLFLKKIEKLHYKKENLIL